MSKKRFLCILISFIFVISACTAMAESENNITLTLSDEGDAISLTTSLLPEQKTTILRAENGDAGEVLALMLPEIPIRLLACFRDAVLEMNKKGAIREEGSYAGDLFDHAKTKEEIEKEEKGE